ncbi:MAG: hypothetical protein R3B84_16445 [Zavarzinella sp.]
MLPPEISGGSERKIAQNAHIDVSGHRSCGLTALAAAVDFCLHRPQPWQGNFFLMPHAKPRKRKEILKTIVIPAHAGISAETGSSIPQPCSCAARINWPYQDWCFMDDQLHAFDVVVNKLTVVHLASCHLSIEM